MNSARSLKFSNRTPYPRNEYAVATIPFNIGEFWGNQDIQVAGQIIHVRPFGRKYANGSYRYGEAILPVSVPAATGGTPGSVTYPLSVTTDLPPITPFLFGPNTTALSAFPAPLNKLQMLLLLNTGAFVFDLTAGVGGTNGPQSIIYDGPRRTARFIGRQGDYVYTLYVYMYHGADYMTWELRVTNSGYWPGPGTSGSTGTQSYTSTTHDIHVGSFMNSDIAMYGETGHQAIGVSGPYPGTAYSNISVGNHWRMGHRASVSATQTAFAYDLNTYLQGYVLSTSGHDWGDGQSQVWRGSLVVPSWNPATLIATYSNELKGNWTHPLIGMCQEWQATTAFGPQGYIAPGAVPGATVTAKFNGYSSWLQTPVASAKDRFRERYVQGPGRSDYIGLLLNSGATGAQPDFGIIEGWDAFASGDPRLAEEYGYLGYHATRRPCHRYNGPDAGTGNAIVHATEASHPDPTKVCLYHDVSFHPDSKTFFYKNQNAANPSGRKPDSGNPHKTEGWSSWKLSHMSANHLYTAYLLNPWSRTLEEELDFVKEAWLFHNPDPNVAHQTWLNHYTQARAVGRSYFTMCQIAMARGVQNYAAGSVLHRLHFRTQDCVMSISTPGTNQPWPIRPSMWGSILAPGRIASISGKKSGTVSMCGPDPVIPNWTIPTNQNFIAPWEELVAVYGLWAAYLLTAEDGQSANFGNSHALAASMLANTMLTHCVMWSATANPWNAYSCPGTTVVGPYRVTNPAAPAWMSVAYRYRWNPDAAGYGIAASAADISKSWYFTPPASQGFNLWGAASIYLLKPGGIPLFTTTSAAERNAFITYVSGSSYDQRWRWGN